MGEALYPWPVLVWFCDYCDKPVGVGEKPESHCHADSMSAIHAAPEFHWPSVSVSTEEEKQDG